MAEPRSDPPTDDQTLDELALDDQALDGNAVGGLLAATFGGEMTDRSGRCAHCGTVSVIGSLRAYVRAPGAVLRCPVCGGVVLRIVETDTALLVDAAGATFLRLPRR